MSSPYAVICVPIKNNPSNYVKAFFPIEVVDYFKSDTVKWYYWPSEMDFYPEGSIPSTSESLRVNAKLFGDVYQTGNTIDFRHCSREHECVVLQQTNTYIIV